jgi:guanylate kinase
VTSEPLLVVLSGPAGVGKDSVLHRLHELGLPFHYTVTATTRAPRAGERHGHDYFFYTREQFMAMIERGQLLEHATVYDHLYGVPKGPVRDALRRGQDVIVRTDIQGAASIRAQAPGATLIFVQPPSFESLAARLRERSADSAAQIALRLAKAREEMAALSRFDYAVVNEDGGLERCVETIVAITTAERCRIHRLPVGLQ